MNTLYYGDNLKILRDYIKDESVDLVYLDPPFNSNRNYNVLFKDESGLEADSQITAFEDTWHWPNAAPTYNELLEEADEVAEMLHSFHNFLRSNQMMAYLVMMAARLKELHRVLKPTGSLYLHCDPTASHYLKILLDTIFGAQNYRNEITWIRTSAHANVTQKYGAVHDLIFFYSRSNVFTWNQQYIPYDDEYIKTFFDQADSNGKRYQRRDLTASMQRASKGQLYEWHGITPPPSRCWAMAKENMDELFAKGRIHFPQKDGGMPRLKLYPEDLPGIPIQDVWTDIRPLHNLASERMGYATQKPTALLERIVNTSTNVDDVVLDPFAGCGTTIAAAEKLKRQWIGIDVTQLSIALLKSRLERDFGQLPKRDYLVVGEPISLQDAISLAHDPDPKAKYQFQYWALSLVGATPLGGQVGGRTGKVGADRGIDGLKYFSDDKSEKRKKVILQVKSGHVGAKDIRDLIGTVESQNAAIGVFITLEPAKKPMLEAAADVRPYKGEHFPKLYPKIQILTIEELLAGKQIDMPPNIQRSRRILPEGDTQNPLFDQERDERLIPEF